VATSQVFEQNGHRAKVFLTQQRRVTVKYSPYATSVELGSCRLFARACSLLLDVFINNFNNRRLDLSMIFCRGCGKQIHNTAQYCPQCGATQGSVANKEAIHWASITSFIAGIIVFLMILTEPDGKWDSDAVLGGMVFGAVPIAFGLYSFSQPSKNGRWMGVTGVVLGVIAVLISLGSK